MFLITAFLPTAAPGACASPPAGLITWWPAEGNADDTVGGLNGTLSGGAGFAAGMVAQAFSLDGVDDYVQIGARSELVMSNALTVEAWIFPTGVGSGPLSEGIIFNKEGEYEMDRMADGTIRWSIKDPSTPMVWTVTSFVAPVNTWTHVALVYDHGVTKVYGNGILVQSVNGPSAVGDQLPALNDFRIGGRQYLSECFKGLIDEVAVYQRALTAAEIQSIYAAGSAGKCAPIPPPACIPPPSGLIAWWPAEGNGADLPGGNPATLLNGTSFAGGVVGQAFLFDGVDDRAIVSNAPALNFGPGQNFSIEAWIQPIAAVTDFGVQSIVDKRYTPNFLSAVGYEFGLVDGKLSCQLADAPLASLDFSGYTAPGPDLRDGLFHHVAMTVDRMATNGGKLYVDGQVVLTFDPTGQPGDLSTTEPLRIGNHADPALNSHFKGRMDEVAIYSRALSAGEIEAIYAAGNAGKCMVSNPPPPYLLAGPVTNAANGHWYYLLAPTNWTAAEAIAVGLGGHLVTMNDAAENTWVYTSFANFGGVARPLWLGLNDSATEGSWVWVDGDPGSYRNWAPGEPNSGGGYYPDEDQAIMRGPAWSSPDAWNDAPGDQIAAAVVEVSPPSSSPCVSVPAGLVSWWRAEGNADDAVGGLNGTLTGGAGFAVGLVGQAFSFDGVDDHVQIGARPELVISSTLTVEAWIFPTGAGSGPEGGGIIISKEGEYVMDRISNGTIRWAIAGTGPWTWTVTPLVAPVNAWTHVTLVYDNGVTKIYGNGSLVQTNNGPSVLGDIYPTLNDFRIGGRQVVSECFKGLIDEVAVFNRALTATEIQSIYAAGSAGKCVVSNPPPSHLLTGPVTNAANGHAYYLLSATNWPAAEAIAVSLGGHLVTVNDAAEDMWVFTTFSTFGGGDRALWTGLTDQATEGDWRWISGDLASYRNWGAGEPNSGGGFFPDEDHVLFWNPSSGYAPGSWADAPSNQLHAAVVEIGGATPPSAAVIAHWTFDEASGPTAHDSAGSFDGSLSPSGASFVSGGISGNALLLNRASNGFVNMGDVLGLTSGDFSLVAWVKMNAGDTTSETVVLGKHAAFYDNGYLIGINSLGTGGQVNKAVFYEASVFTAPVSTTSVNDGDWHQIVAVYQSGGNKFIYVDGAPAESVEPSQAFLSTSAPFLIGGDAPGGIPRGLFTGLIDDVQIYNQALSADEVDYLFQYPGQVIPVCVSAPSGLVSWWRAEGSGQDETGGNNGTLQGGATFAAGKVGQAFAFDGMNSSVAVPASASLNVGAGNGFSVEGWINPSTIELERPIVEWNSVTGGNPYPYGVHLWISVPVGYGAGPGCLYANIVDTGGAFHWLTSAGGLVTTNTYQHVALTYDRASGQALLYLEGAVVASQNLGSFTPQTSYSLYLGSRPGGVAAAYSWAGQMDEVSIYDRVLTANEIAAISSAGSAGKCAAVNPPPTFPYGPITNAANGHWYYLIASNTWDGAEAQAITLGGHLVTINDAAENAWVLSTFGNFGGVARPLWIGLNDAAAEGNFVWVSGDPATYRNWMPGEPNNGGGYYPNEDHVGMRGPGLSYSDAWNDAPDADVYVGVVEVQSASPPPPQCVNAPSGLVSWWPGENSATDMLGGNTGTIAGTGTVTYSPGIVGQAFVFDGTHRDRVDLGNPVSLRLEDFTLEAWVKRSSPTVTSFDVLGADGSVAGDGACIIGYGRGGYILALANDGRMILSRTDLDGLYSAPLVADTNWHHLAVTKSGLNAVFYLDGVPQATPAYDHPAPYTFDDANCTCTAAIAIGSRGDARGGTFFGMIDEPAVFNRPLSTAEIQSIYAAGSAGKCVGATPATFPYGPITNAANGHWYYLIASNTWDGAEAQAVTLGGHLVTINDAAENAWVLSTFGNFGGVARPLWIGLNDAAAEGSFVWVSGDPATYRNWMPGEPNNGGGYYPNEDHVGMRGPGLSYSDAWNDAPDADVYVGVVEISPPSSPPCVSVPAGLVSWWRAEQNALDSADSNNGTLQGGAGFVSGEVGQAFNLDGVNGYVSVPASANLNVGLGDGFTLECWIKPTDVSNAQPLIEWFSGVGPPWGVHFWISEAGSGTGPGCLFMNVPSTGGAEHLIGTVAGLVGTSGWQHVAATYDKATGVARLFYNGQLKETQNLGSFTPQTSYPLYLGRRPPGTYAGVLYRGGMDEVSVYSRALSTNEIQAIYAAGSAGKCAPAPPPACISAPPGIVSWWRSEQNALDSADGNHGTFHGSAGFAPGEVGQAFSFDGINGYVSVPASANLNVGLGDGFTLDCWIKPNDVSGPRPLAEWNDNSGTVHGVHFWISELVSGGGVGSLYANLIDTGGSYHQISSVGGIVGTSGFQHVALSYDKATGVARLYYNGGVVATQNLGVFAPQTSYPLYLGKRTSGVSAGTVYGGLMDEVTLYSRALSPSEVQAIYAVGSAGKCVISNPPPPYLLAGPITNAANGHWYYLLDATNWPAAEQIGVSLGGHLATINNAAENNWVFTNFSSFGGGDRALWTGLNDAGQENIWFWVSSQPVTYFNWAPGEPNSGGGFFPDEDHVLMWNPSSGFPLGTWSDAPSNQLHAAVIEVGPPEPVILGGPITNAANGHWYFLLNCTNWPAAERIAVSLGGHLATINNAAENTWIFDTFSTFGGLERPMWIGLNDAAQEGAWVWVSGEPVTYLNWSPIEPNSGGGVFPDEDHVMMWHPSSGYPLGSWNDGPSNHLEYAVVEVAPPPPLIVSQPTNMTVYVGSNATFRVTATGGAPLKYQWYFESSPLAGKTASTLALTGVQTDQAGNYWAVVTNDYGTVRSSNALLTVLIPPPCVLAPTGAVAWWRAESNTWDSVSINDAIASGRPPLAPFITGKVGSAFRTTLGNYFTVPASDELDVGAGGGLTVEGWIQPASKTPTIQPVFEWNDGKGNVGVGLMLYSSYLDVYLTDTNTTPVRRVVLRSPAGVLTNSVWGHVALTFDQTSGLAELFINGSSVAQTNLGSFRPQTRVPLYFGYRPSGTYSGSYYVGALDEMTIYNRALSPAELQAIVAADLSGKCPPPPICSTPPADMVAWWRGESNVLDHVDGNHGVITQTVSYATGRVGRAFSLTTGYIRIPGTASLNVGSGPGLTLEAWINPTQYKPQPIMEWNDGGHLAKSLGVSLSYSYSGAAGALEANLVDTNGVSHFIRSPGSTVTYAAWQHVAISYDRTSGLAALYYNGKVVAQTNLGSFTPKTASDLYLGYRPTGSYPGSGIKFTGYLDEAAVYARALTAAEIKAIVKARGEGKCKEPPAIVTQPANLRVNLGADAQFPIVATGNPLLRYQWFKDGFPLSGATSESLALPAVQDVDAGNYTVRITNWFGSVLSSNAVLTVNHAPTAFIVVAPLAQLPGFTNLVVIAPACASATVVLDGARSSDVDDDSLQYVWTEGANPLATGVMVTNLLAPGSHTITLTVNDGLAEASTTATIEVLAPAQAVLALEDQVRSGHLDRQRTVPLLEALQAARVAFENCHGPDGIHELAIFQRLVHSQVAVQDPALAAALYRGAQEIMDSLREGYAGARPPCRFTTMVRQANGCAWMQFDAPQSGVYRVEASTNFVDWETIGVAARQADGAFEFEDVNASRHPSRFYRIVSP